MFNTKVVPLNLNSFETFMILFIVIQPLLDLLTSWMEMHMHVTLTIGILVRGIVMAIGFVYILFHVLSGLPTIEKRAIFYYLMLLIAFYAVHLGILLFTKEHLHLSSEIKSIFKFVYPIILLFTYILIFKKYNDIDTILKLIVVNIVIIGFTMLLAALTNTQIPSYAGDKIGHSGWFFASNELGAIIASILPFLFIYSITYTTKPSKMYYWTPVFIGIVAGLSIGTKVSYLACVILLGVTASLCTFFLLLPSSNKKQFKTNLIISLVALVGLICITPFTPLAYNSNSQMKAAQLKVKAYLKKTKNDDELTSEQKTLLDNQVKTNLIFSSRDVYAQQFKKAYMNAPVSQKLFGMGYGSSSKINKPVIEMDPLDIFYSFGIIGFSIYWLPYFTIAVVFLRRFIQHFREVTTFFNYITAISIAMLMGISLIAGHVFSAPAVSIYVSLLIALLYTNTTNPCKQ